MTDTQRPRQWIVYAEDADGSLVCVGPFRSDARAEAAASRLNKSDDLMWWVHSLFTEAEMTDD